MSMGFGGRRHEPVPSLTRRQKVAIALAAAGMAAILTPLALLVPYPTKAAPQAPQPVVTRQVDDTVIVPGLFGGLPF